MTLIEEIRRLRGEGWPPITAIDGPTRVGDKFMVTFIDRDGEGVGEPIELSSVSEAEATEMVERARSQIRW
jgi:hypothetical protein